MNRKAKEIYTELERERKKLCSMPLGSDLMLKQSRLVDELINEYYRAVAGGRRMAG
ncbi:hypothetical protein DCCM_2677 [Desulfocucumis palustris]|uniref:Spo0E like sporulation regulatory protein n=1 Tax=Desulfocucumis palustris TaxID=1898651 RepID=A0A2L2XC52_9FIRM|nr:hypothetical protein [Desulfocucumis palustris]GBF33574.1 hypothetical protein DCCM_2677 [Desulfocucumis palustris]